MSIDSIFFIKARLGSVATGSIGSLLVAFVIICVECQKHWFDSTGTIYLGISGVMLLVWVAHLSGWKAVSNQGNTVVDAAIFVLFVASIIFRLTYLTSASIELSLTLLFWAPLIVAWWTWRLENDRIILAGLFCIFFALLFWLTPKQSTGIQEHLFLLLLIVFFIHKIRQPLQASTLESTINLRDELTGLASPEYFETELAHVSAMSDRYQLPLTLVGCRIGIADQNSIHLEALRLYTDAITDRLRASDTACRWNENTFIVLLPNTRETNANIVSKNIAESLQNLATNAIVSIPSTIMLLERLPGEDPMSTLGRLESRLAEVIY